MGGAVSSGRDNDELVDNLIIGHYIRSKKVEKVFRALDRADYMTPEAREEAYKDLAWRSGTIHLSSPCIYSEVMEGLDLRPGQSFLNIGSGTGYLSTLAGLILGSSGISHGVEIEPSNVEYANKKLRTFMETSPILDEFDFCEPKFFVGNGLTLAPLHCGYDRVYCGAGCPDEYRAYMKNLIKVGGILVMPVQDTLLQIKRVRHCKWVASGLLTVSFVTLRKPTQEEAINQIKLAVLRPPRLEVLARSRIRGCVRAGVLRAHPELVDKRRRPTRNRGARRILIPIQPSDDGPNLNGLHDLDEESGANEMNALLSLVISMRQNQVGGTLRFDRLARPYSDSDSGPGAAHSSEEESEHDDSDHGSDTTEPEPLDSTLDTSATNNDPTSATDDTESETVQTKQKTDTEKTEENKSDLDASRSLDNDHETLSESDSSLVDNLRVKIKQLKARRARKIDKLRRLSKQLSREVGICRASTSRQRQSNAADDSSTDEDADVVQDSEDNDDSPGASETVEVATPEAESTKTQEASTSAEMEWENFNPVGEKDEVCKSKAKRQKLDSGIGENTPSGEEQSSGHTSPSDSWEDIDTESSPHSERKIDAGRIKRRAAEEARRARFTDLMRSALRDLPLPPLLYKYVSLGRLP